MLKESDLSPLPAAGARTTPWQLNFSRFAEEALRRMPPVNRVLILRRITLLGDDPHPQGAVKLSGKSHHYRVREAGYRVLYEVNPKERALHIVDIRANARLRR